MPNIPEIKINNTTYKVKDTEARNSANYVKKAVSSLPEDENSEIFSKIIWEVGAISTDNGVEYDRTDCVRTQFIPIGEGDIVQLRRLDISSPASGWYANAFYYDSNMTYLGAVRPGNNAYAVSFMRIPSMAYSNVAYVRFLVLSMYTPVSGHKSVWRISVKKVNNAAYEQKLRNLQNDYDIINLDFTNAGGISDGNPYDIATDSKRFRTVTGYPFPIGSKIIIPDGLTSIYTIWVSKYCDSGRYIGSYSRPSEDLDSVQDSDFANQTENYYIALSGKTLEEITVVNDMVEDLQRIIKIAVPKSRQIKENRIGGNVTGAINLFDRVPFQYSRHDYFYKTDGILFKQMSEDYRLWAKNNSDFSISLPAGTYHILFHFVENTGSDYSAVAYKVFNNAGDALIDIGSRSWANYDNEKTFTLAGNDTVYLQWKSYAGNVFEIYMYEEGFDTLKMVSNKVKSLESYTGEGKYTNIYTEPVQDLIKRYDATVDAGKIGYIWISDLHINSLYPNRNKALKRQLMACADIANRTNIQFIMIGGDIIDRETSHDTIFALFNEVFSGVKDSRRPVALILGNHDDNPYTNPVPLTKGQTRALFIDMNSVDMVAPDTSKSYYYFDKNGYRFICLDGIDYPSGYAGDSWWGFSQAQVEWFANVLLNSNQKIVILSHISLDEDHNWYGLGNNGGFTKDVRDLMEAYNARSAITLYGNSYDFSSKTGKILYSHAGHAHFDEQYTKSGTTIPMLITTCAKDETSTDSLELVSGNTYKAVGNTFNTVGWFCKFWPNRTLETINEAAFDVVSIGNSTVNVFRLGAGEDRSFSIT